MYSEKATGGSLRVQNIEVTLRQGPEASSQFHEGILSKSESHLLYLWDAQMSVSWFLSLEHLFT